MTSRQVFEAVLIELNKVQAPSLLLEDFNYLFNKAIYQYINKKYNIYDVNQQTSDDVRVLKSTVVLVPNETNLYTHVEQDRCKNNVISKDALYGNIKEFNLPLDYLHLLNCICNFKVTKTFKCYNAGDYVQFPAIRLTSDAWSQIINNFYMRPMYKRPYYFIHNVNTQETIPTNPYNNKSQLNSAHDNTGTDFNDKYYTHGQSCEEIGGALEEQSNLPRTIKLPTNTKEDLVEKPIGTRVANPTTVRLEVRYGKDTSIFQLENIWVDYIKAPQHIRLTQEQLDLTQDTSQIMEFPDYVCQEIINELVHIVMENSSDPRLQTHIPVNQSIANPAQAQAPKK